MSSAEKEIKQSSSELNSGSSPDEDVEEHDVVAINMLPAEYIKLLAERSGHFYLADDVAKELGEHVTTQLRAIVRDAIKFMNHSKRTRLLTQDLDSALLIKHGHTGRNLGFPITDCQISCPASEGICEHNNNLKSSPEHLKRVSLETTYLKL